MKTHETLIHKEFLKINKNETKYPKKKHTNSNYIIQTARTEEMIYLTLFVA